jgi:hypothetical protein
MHFDGVWGNANGVPSISPGLRRRRSIYPGIKALNVPTLKGLHTPASKYPAMFSGKRAQTKSRK